MRNAARARRPGAGGAEEAAGQARAGLARYHRAMRERKEHLDALAVALLIACCLFWGFQQILIKSTVGEVPPLWQAALRFAGATVLLGVWCAARGIPLFERD